MNDDEKKEKLNQYLIAVDRLKRKCDDAERWETMSFGPSGSLKTRTGHAGPDEIKETAIEIRQECESMAIAVRNLRKEMDDAFSCMKDQRLRSYLESKYIDGMSDAKLSERSRYSLRHMRRLITQAVRELDRSSTYFS